MTRTPRLAAFTLIELLVVISILALLAGIAVPTVYGAMEAAWASATHARMHSIKLALDAYRSAFHAYPPSNPALIERALGSAEHADTGSEALRVSMRGWFRASDGTIVIGQGFRVKKVGGVGVVKSLYEPGGDHEEFASRDPKRGFGGAARGYFFAGAFPAHRPILYFKARSDAGGANPLTEAHNAKIINKWLASPAEGRLSFDDWTRRNGVFVGGSGILLIHPGPDGLYRNRDDFLVP